MYNLETIITILLISFVGVIWTGYIKKDEYLLTVFMGIFTLFFSVLMFTL
jgi:hypothetical protein